MASSSTISNNDFVVLELRDPLSIESEITEKKEIFISTTEISTWNLSSILSSQLIKVEADRNHLIQESTYFRGLLTGNFSESCLDCVSIEWNLESFINVMKSIYGFSSNVTADNFLTLLEGALFFGVETLLLECKTWLLKTTCTTGVSSLNIDLDIIIEIWNFGFDHAIDFIPELCTGYLARNFVVTSFLCIKLEMSKGCLLVFRFPETCCSFISCVSHDHNILMWIMSCSSFANVPYKLLCHCIEHPQLTVDSEKHLAEALLVWLESKKALLGCSSSDIEDACIDILQKVRARLLPIGFAAGKRKSLYFSKLADKSISAILSLIKDPYMRDALKDGDLNDMRIRLTEFTEKIDLSGCPQMTLGFLLISVLPSYNMDPISRKKIKESLNDLEHLDLSPSQISQNLFPTLSFEAVHEVDISNCPQLHLVGAIECFCNSFPSLRTLKASYLLQFRMSTLFYLVQKCPLVDEVDLTADLSPAVPTQVSTISTSVDGYRDLDAPSYKVLKERPLVSNLRKLTLEGRSDVNDLDLLNISAFASSLSYLNLKGCASVTDVGISKLISKCVNLKSINVSDTYFGRISILALISDFPSSDDFPGVHGEHKYSDSLAFRLQKLDISGCKSVDTTSLFQLMCHTYLLKSLCLRDTSIVDDALYNFLGSSLERLDVSETMVSGAALVHIIKRNHGMKLLKARGCRNLCCRGSNIEATALPDKVLSHSDFSEVDELCVELGKNCILKEVAFGWGFHSLSLENLGPAIGSLKAITVSLGASLGEVTLKQLAKICPLLESVVLYFQEISDSIVISLVESLRHLQVLALCYCLGDLSSLCFNLSMPNLRTLKLERVAPWLTNDDLVILTQNCGSLAELSLSGCSLLNSGLIKLLFIYICCLQILYRSFLMDGQECGYVTSKGVSSLFDCKALESLLLRHNGRGIQRNFIVEASSKMPMLRKVALDLCDASEGGFDSPSYAERFNLRIVKIAKCKQQRCAFDLQNSEACRSVMLHKESIVLEWNSKELRTTIVKERV